jgi:hypothetical protein
MRRYDYDFQATFTYLPPVVHWMPQFDPKAKYNLRMAAMLLFYILQKSYFNKSCIFSENLFSI